MWGRGIDVHFKCWTFSGNMLLYILFKPLLGQTVEKAETYSFFPNAGHDRMYGMLRHILVLVFCFIPTKESSNVSSLTVLSVCPTILNLFGPFLWNLVQILHCKFPTISNYSIVDAQTCDADVKLVSLLRFDVICGDWPYNCYNVTNKCTHF